MPTTLAKIDTVETAIEAQTQDTDRRMTAVVMPPGFEEQPSRPIVYVGGEEEGGLPFYSWNHDTNSREYVPTARFSASLLELKTLVKNADDPKRAAVKLVAEFQTASGARVAMSMGAKTYSALGLVAGLSALDETQLRGVIGLSGKTGKSGVTFVSVFSDGKLMRNPNSEDLLKESRQDDAQVEAIEGLIGEINAKLAATA